MYVAILVGILAMFFAYQESSGKYKNSLKWAFIIITIYLGIRYDFGNDYMNYLNSFYRFQSYHGSLLNIQELKELQGHGDFGWVYLNLLCRPLGFFGMIIFLAILENFIIYDFVKTYVPSTWYPFAIFIYVFNSNIMILGGSMMRQWLAICIFIYAFRFIRDRKPLYYFALAFLAISIHGSARILLPLYLLTYMRDINLSVKSLYWFIPLLIVWFSIAPTVFANNLTFLLESDSFEQYGIYEGGTGEKYGILGIVAAFLFPVICISQINKLEQRERVLVLIFFVSILIRPLGLVLGMINRLGFYFLPFSIVTFPIVLNYIKKKYSKTMVFALLVIIVIPTIRDFYGFFHAETWIDKYMEYSTIIGLPWQ